MTPDAELHGRRTLTPGRAVLLGTLAVGVLDLLDALVFFGARGVPPVRILHSIASGLLGRAAFGGGTATALLGLAIHFAIACAVVVAYHAASSRLPELRRRPLLWGPLYGVLVWVVMNRLVLPLTPAMTGTQSLPVVINGLLIHALGVGLPSALSAWAVRPEERTPARAALA
jgi:hypothetical protein